MSDTPDQSPAVDFDQLLESVDPGFTRSLEDLTRISNADVEIAADALDLDGPDDEDDLPHAGPPADASRAVRLRYHLVGLLAFLLFFARRSFDTLKFLAHAFKNASRAQKGLALLLVVITGLVVYLLVANLRGTWLPSIGAPVVGHLAPYADKVTVLDAKELGDRVDLNAAYPAETHEFLFRRFKVNLRATKENPQPMGAFEFVVSTDTKETLIEARDREVEFADAVERLFEEQTFHDLATEFGKAQLKNRLQGTLNDKLSAGRVTAVNFKTFILKP